VTDIDPTDCVFDVEEHAAATLRFTLRNGARLTVDYERAFCTHGDETNTNPLTFQIEGTRGAVRWEWFTDGGGQIWHSFDRAGKRETELIEVAKLPGPGIHQKPLVYFHQRVQGMNSPAFVNETALFNLELMRAIYDCANTGTAQLEERVP
jgi:predicted dehydrogenase